LQKALTATLPGDVSINDLGAGAGLYVRWLREEGWPDTFGYDGTPGIETISKGCVKQLDLTRTNVGWSDRLRPAQWTICIEVGEHIPKDFEGIFFDNLSNSSQDAIILSWGLPGQRGRDHINCRLPEYVACQMGRRGWNVAHDATIMARKLAGKGWDRKLMVFET
jgi:hypothetical protein